MQIPKDKILELLRERGEHDKAAQAEAEEAGKRWARENGGGEVFTHRDEGEFSRIRKGDAV